MMDIDQWLHALGLDQYAPAFAENDIDLAMLAQLNDADLKELGILSLGHRKRILLAIADQRDAALCAASCAVNAPAGERRQVTILFADLCGFTALSQALDPEELRDVTSRYTALVDSIVLGYGGTIDKHIGDAVMAIFGAPRAHDTDPLRAARAALDIHEALNGLSAGLSGHASRTLKAHVGIASGEVVAGPLGRADVQDYTVLGDSVNLAARLVAAAGPGETLLSDSVHRTLGSAVISEVADTMRFKGIDMPVRVWRLHGLTSDTGTASRSPFVGRKAEFEQFKGLVHACLQQRVGQVVYVRGEAGIGKTRLVEEMRRFAETLGMASHRGLVLDFGVGKDQDPIRTIVGSMLGLPAGAGADADARRAAAARIGASGAVGAEQLMFIHDILDLTQTGEWRTLYDAMDSSARTRGKRTVVRTIAEEACRRGPIMIVVEDLHWADPQVLGYLSALASAVTKGPGLLVMTSRVDGDPLDAAWRASCRATSFATIDLGPLRCEEALHLAGGFIDATGRIARACIERAGGNPLFLEQLLHNAEEGREEAVPATIQSLVLARMDRLPPREREAFQAAAVIGQRFGLALLRRLIDDPEYVCDGLVANALVLPEGEDFLFAHALIQESAYSTLLRARRRELHRLTADWFAPTDPVLRAQHLDRAEDDRAPRAYLDAAIAQRTAYFTETALRLVERGLELAQTNEDRHALICFRGELQRDLGDIAASIATYRAAVAAAPDEASLCQSQLGLAEGLRVSEGLAEALALLEAAQQVAQRRDMVPELARLHHLRGNILFPLGKIADCRAQHEHGLAYAQRLGSPEAEARSLGGLADAAYAQGRMRTAFEYFSRCVALSREHGFGRIEVANRSMAGFSRIYLNEAREAREDASAAARAAALVGQPRAQMLCETLGVFACYEMGDMEATLIHLEREMQLILQLGARRFEAQSAEMRARVLLDSGHRKDAAELLREALTICREVGTQFSAPKAVGALSRAVEDDGERERLLREGADLLRRGAVGHNHLWFYRDAIEAMLSASDAAGALRYVATLEDYARAEPLPWADLFAARGRALARALQDHSREETRQELRRVRAALVEAGFNSYLPAMDAALAA
ncbi:Adenylate and Guanylate cyclase catalytic domain protein (plasmid) [Caballeronia sp. SBC1]|uniref:adenylate/guanylate cyclase domain-containing protein n=1 Tax=unclassified Caballeronia TaxID=2646786 RepID=UPI0013E0EF37|nr:MULTISPECIES: adenylate/guanylate cyclase domain-containing protein [unclassified Caballeronia]QIE26529.1 Adenylate and Guanylate cyclase catalytic domain protein [Caballeronia sp. SBC2]QIN64155.1 Adenylate and Guanylate cyclase catalytic domain protein [Caballeronia sp. SBC1]